MKNTFALLLSLSLTCSLSAQPVYASLKKVAVVSLIGDAMTIDTYRRRVGTGVDANHQETIALSDPVFDYTALSTAESALAKMLPATSSVALLAVPSAGSDFDPARLLMDGNISPSNPLVVALRKSGFTHLLAITKHRAPARLQLAGLTVGSGYLSGLGFYVDNHLPTKNLDTGKTGSGFVAPYVFIRLVLVELGSLDVRGEQTITASTSRSAADDEAGFSPWGSMSAEEKFSALRRLIQERVAGAVPELLRMK